MIEAFGQTKTGEAVRRITLSNGKLRLAVLTLGAILQDLQLHGHPVNVGATSLDAYDGGPLRFFGAVIGPVAGRISGARGTIGDTPVQMDTTEGENALHSGSAGLHRKIWSVEHADTASVTLTCDAPAGQGGLPGNRRFRARYALSDSAMRLTLEAETDAPTWVNLTQHSYWHMGGPPGIDGHRLRIWAERFLPIDETTLPTGDVAPVQDTPYDFRAERAIQAEDVLDHCFCLANAPRALSTVATLTAKDGRRLTLSTEAPGLQVHTGDGVVWPAPSAAQAAEGTHRPGLALEAQDWPDAPNHPRFPSILLQPGTLWQRTTVFALHGP